jgi:hypothetical protein
VSISLAGLARFGCDLSATVGGIPNFGHGREARAARHAPLMALCSWARGWIGIAPGTGGIHQSIRQLRQDHGLDPLPAAIAGQAFAVRGTRRAAIQVPRGRNYPRMGVATAISNASLCGALATAGRPGTSGFAEETTRCWLHPTQRQITSWALWAADVGVSALLGLRRFHR